MRVERINMENSINCKLCNAIRNEKSEYLWEDKLCVILPTKDLKGHRKRIMILTKFHQKTLPKIIEKKYIGIFKNFCKKYFNEEPTYALVESTYASIPNHWHIVACDWFGNEDLKQLHYTPHVALQTKVKWEK